MYDRFQHSGNFRFRSDRLIKLHSGRHSTPAHFFSNKEGIPSGPGFDEDFIPQRASKTSLVENCNVPIDTMCSGTLSRAASTC